MGGLFTDNNTAREDVGEAVGEAALGGLVGAGDKFAGVLFGNFTGFEV